MEKNRKKSRMSKDETKQSAFGITEKDKEYARKHPETIFSGAVMTDVLGSYTGQPIDRYEKPVQDADDL